MLNKSIAVGAIFGMLGVMLGAFGTHSLRETLTPANLEIFKTGTQYQLIHAVALILCGLAAPRLKPNLGNAASILLVVGIVIFCGSLYGLSAAGIRALGAVAPIGGSCLIIGWFCFAIAAWKGDSEVIPTR